MSDPIKENPQNYEGASPGRSPLESPEKKKFKMKIKGDCFLYTSFYMIKKWFLVMVALNHSDKLVASVKNIKMVTPDKWFVVGVIFALPVLIPVAALFLGLILLLLTLLILAFILACILLFFLVIFLDLPLLLVLIIQAFLFTELLTNLQEVTNINWLDFVVYFQLSLIIIVFYNVIAEVSNACDNMLFMVNHYKEKKEESKLYWFFILVSVIPQVLQITIIGFLSYFTPQVLLATTDLVSAIQDFSFLYVIIKVNAFMTAVIRDTKWYKIHGFVFNMLEERGKVNKIHVSAAEMEKKVKDLKREMVFSRSRFGGIFLDNAFSDVMGLWVFKALVKLLVFGLFVGTFACILNTLYSTDSGSSDTTSAA